MKGSGGVKRPAKRLIPPDTDSVPLLLFRCLIVSLHRGESDSNLSSQAHVELIRSERMLRIKGFGEACNGLQLNK